MIRILLAVLILSGCTNKDGVLLRWKPGQNETLAFNTVIQEVAFNDLNLPKGVEVINNVELRQEVKKMLIDLKLPEATSTSYLSHKGTDIRVRFVGRKPDDRTPAENKFDKIEREVAALFEGKYRLVADIDTAGTLQSFYLHQKQKNLISLFFELPKTPVNIGDTWSININWVDIGTNYFSNRAERINKVYLDEINVSEEGESIASLFYVINEEVDGYFQNSEADKQIPTSVSFTYFASGKYYIDRGHWKELKAVGSLSSSGISQNNSLSVFAMSPVEPQ